MGVKRIALCGRLNMSRMHNEIAEMKQAVISLHDNYMEAIRDELQLQRSQQIVPLQQPTKIPSPTHCTLTDKPERQVILNDDTDGTYAPTT